MFTAALGLLRGMKLSTILFLVALAAGGTFVGLKMLEIRSLKSDIEDLTKQNAILTVDNKILTENNSVLKANQKTLTEANTTNYETAKKLEAERAQAKAAIASLAAANQRDRATLNLINKKIDEMAKDPANDGPVAPVLRETIRQIQEQRDAK